MIQLIEWGFQGPQVGGKKTLWQSKLAGWKILPQKMMRPYASLYHLPGLAWWVGWCWHRSEDGMLCPGPRILTLDTPNWVYIFPHDVVWLQWFCTIHYHSPMLPHKMIMTFRENHPNSSGWWLTYPSEKYDFVSWGYDIPNWMESHKNHVPLLIFISHYIPLKTPLYPMIPNIWEVIKTMFQTTNQSCLPTMEMELQWLVETLQYWTRPHCY